MIWIIFIFAALAVLISGQRLTRAAGQLAEVTGMSHGFVGVILLGLITSLPELVSTISATLFCNAPNLALGNIFGSNAANLAILAFLDLAIVRNPNKERHKLNEENQLTAYLSLIIISMALMGLASQGFWHILHIDLFSLLIATIYIIGLQKLHRFQLSDIPGTNSLHDTDTPGKIIPPELKRRLLINAAIIVAASMTLAASAEHIATITGWGTTFVGNSLLAIATSLPEIVVTISAVRIGSFAMAAGNIFGSNIFNIAILALADLFFFRSSLFAAASSSQSLIAAIGLLMTGLYLFAGRYASEKRIAGRWPIDSLLVIGTYLFSLYALFSLR